MEIRIIKSNRKTVSIAVNADLTVTMRVPMRITKRETERILKDKEAWILARMEEIRQKKAAYEAAAPERLNDEELRELAKKARSYIPERLEHFAKLIGVSYGSVSIRNQKTRWGSCSSKGNLNFNCLLMLTPAEVIDYVVVHELCHRKEMNHSKAFWAEVEKILPDYKQQVKWLKEHGADIMSRQNYLT